MAAECLLSRACVLQTRASHLMLKYAYLTVLQFNGPKVAMNSVRHLQTPCARKGVGAGTNMCPNAVFDMLRMRLVSQR